MTPDFDLWLWALPSGRLERRPVKGKMWMSVFLNRMFYIYKSWMMENTSLWCSWDSAAVCMTCSMKACFTLYWSTSLHFLLRLHELNLVSSCSLISFPTFFDSLLHHFFFCLWPLWSSGSICMNALQLCLSLHTAVLHLDSKTLDAWCIWVQFVQISFSENLSEP